MISETVYVFSQELRAFFRSGAASILLLLVTVLVWGIIISGKVETISSSDSWLWVVFFALAAGAGFSTPVFVRERLSSTLEILIISGAERSSILWGKLLFTITMTIISGLGAFFSAWIIRSLLLDGAFIAHDQMIKTVVLYVSSSFTVTASSAWLSLALTNLRLVQFITFLILAAVSVLFALSAFYWSLSIYVLCAILLVCSILMSFGAVMQFSREKIIQPLIY